MKTRNGLPYAAVACILGAFSGGTPSAVGQLEDSQASTTQPAPDEAASPASQPMALQSLIQELPDYSGNLWNRSYLTGDWGGERTRLAEQGILFDFDLTQIIQGNAHGGRDTNDAFRYSGSVDYKFRFDTARMGLWPGGLITLRGETQFGSNIFSKVGSISPVNYDALLPIPGECGKTTLSEFSIAQALSEKLVLVAGKLDMTVGDDNVFAHNERTQFMNASLRINPLLFPSAPYTTMGAGVILLPTKWLTINTFLTDNDPEGAVTKTGFNTAFHDRDWYSIMQEYTIKVKPFDLPGHQRFGWFWTSRDFINFANDPRLGLPVRLRTLGLIPNRVGPFKLPRPLRGVQLGNTFFSPLEHDKHPDDWGFYYNFDQYLYTEADDPDQGFGLFGRFGWSTGESNPIEQFYSIGVGGKGSIPSRDRDTWGLGYYMINLTDDLPVVLGLDAEQGVELFYNYEVTPWLHVSPSVQVVVDPGAGFADRDVAIVYGVRAQMSF